MGGGDAKAEDREGRRHRKLANYAHLGDIHLEVSLELGRQELPLGEAAQLRIGDVIELNKLAGESLELRINDHLFAEGEVVVVTDIMACRITRLTPET